MASPIVVIGEERDKEYSRKEYEYCNRKLLAEPDALSHHPDLLPLSSIDNDGITLLSPSLFINLIDTALSQCIGSASKGDLLVLNALQFMDESTPIVLYSCMSNWQLEEDILTYRGCVYIPSDDTLHHSILARCHDHEIAGYPGYLKTQQLVAAEF